MNTNTLTWDRMGEMPLEIAESIIRDCAELDLAGETGGTPDDPARALEMWLEVSGECDDQETVVAILTLGARGADVYADHVRALTANAHLRDKQWLTGPARQPAARQTR